MKLTACTIVMICTASIVGCSSDSSLPTQPQSGTVLQPVESSNVIHEDQTLADPLNKADELEVVGDVRFDVRLSPILSRNEVDVDISFNGQANSSIIDGPEGWPISGKSEETLDLGSQGSRRINHTYAIPGYFEPLSLRVSYLVTDTKVQVEGMYLVSATADVAAH